LIELVDFCDKLDTAVAVKILRTLGPSLRHTNVLVNNMVTLLNLLSEVQLFKRSKLLVTALG